MTRQENLLIGLNPPRTHAEVSWAPETGTGVDGEHVVAPGGAFLGISYEQWRQHAGRSVDVVALQHRARDANLPDEPPAPRPPTAPGKRPAYADPKWRPLLAVCSVALLVLAVFHLGQGRHIQHFQAIVFGSAALHTGCIAAGAYDSEKRWVRRLPRLSAILLFGVAIGQFVVPFVLIELLTPW